MKAGVQENHPSVLHPRILIWGVNISTAGPTVKKQETSVEKEEHQELTHELQHKPHQKQEDEEGHDQEHDQ